MFFLEVIEELDEIEKIEKIEKIDEIEKIDCFLKYLSRLSSLSHLSPILSLDYHINNLLRHNDDLDNLLAVYVFGCPLICEHSLLYIIV